ncbi:hypothetical protein V498_00086 [Pseudogymnoascus sp. VKM F-4517 (FW-2822)]|nr:hypothetical protein V498_00086 [Pseudogymnoascus sp. VKM F-4517 (FW-2822)]
MSDFVGHLPISVIAIVALPLALLYLDSKLSSNTVEQTTSQPGFYSYTEFLRLLGLRFEFVDTVTNIISNAVQSTSSALLRIGYSISSGVSNMDPKLLDPPANPVGGWCDILAYHPRLYFRVLFLLDSSLSRGQHPSNAESSYFTLLEPSSPSSLNDIPIEIRPLTSVVAANSSTVAQRPKPLPQEKNPVWLEKRLRESNSERLQQVHIRPAQVQKQLLNDEYPILSHDIFEFSVDAFEFLIEERNLECDEKIKGEEDAD